MLETMSEKLIEKGREEILQKIVLNKLEEEHDISYIAKICNIAEEKVLEIKTKYCNFQRVT